MDKDAIEKYFPWAMVILNMILSSVGSANGLPAVIAGYTTESLIIALIAAAIGTIVGLKNFRFNLLVVILVGVLLVPVFVWYSDLLSQSGASQSQRLRGLMLYFYIYFAIFYVLINLEIALKDFLRSKSP